ncbi:MAG: hypothetical protein RLZZ450_2509 [Pseudomonadota bacterium]
MLPPTEAQEVGKTGAKLAHDITARSAGWGLGTGGALIVNGKPLAAGARGISLFQVDADGTSTLVGSFDTCASEAASDDFVKAVRAVRRGTVVALVVADDASVHFSARADQAIRKLGGTQSLRGAYRASYALIGVKGAPSGTALESFAVGRVAGVTVGRPPSRAVRGSLWHELHIEPRPR